MLSPSLEQCPVCGARLPKAQAEGSLSRDMLPYVLLFLAIALIPLLIGIGIGLICILTGKLAS